MTDMESKVFAAAESLKLAGRKVTSESVRQAIGGGSLRDVCPALRRWRESAETPGAAASVSPPDVAAVFRKAEEAVWALAAKRIDERIAQVQAECALRVSRAECERDEALEEIARLENRVDVLTNELHESRAQAHGAIERVGELRGRLGAMAEIAGGTRSGTSRP